MLRFSAKDGMMVLLCKRSIPPHIFKWCLPGELLGNDELPDTAARREVLAETGLRIHHLEQLHTFGELQRDPRGRVMSVSYFSLLRPSASKLTPGAGSRESGWFPVSELPVLAFDHEQIIRTALEQLRRRMPYEALAFELLDQKFPVSELEKLYEWVYDRPVDRRNFQKRIHAMGLLVTQQEKLKHPLQGRPAQLFSFNRERYTDLQDQKEQILIY